MENEIKFFFLKVNNAFVQKDLFDCGTIQRNVYSSFKELNSTRKKVYFKVLSKQMNQFYNDVYCDDMKNEFKNFMLFFLGEILGKD